MKITYLATLTPNNGILIAFYIRMYLPSLVLVFAILSSIETLKASVIKKRFENLKTWKPLEPKNKQQINSHRNEKLEIRGNS